DCVDVMAYGIFRKVTTPEFFLQHFAKSGHGDGLLMTRQPISIRKPPLHHLTRSVRRTSGFVLAEDSFRMQNRMLMRCFKTLFSIRSINRDFHTRETQFTAMDVRGYGESDQEQWRI